MTNTPDEPNQQVPPVYSPPSAGNQSTHDAPQYVPPTPYYPAPQAYGAQTTSGARGASEGDNYILASILVATIGFVFGGGLITGAVAVFLAHKAEKLGADAQLAKIVAYIALGLGVVGVLLLIMVFGLGMFGSLYY